MPQFMILQDQIERIHIRTEGKFTRQADVLNGLIDAFVATDSGCDDVRFSFCGAEVKAKKLSPDTVMFEVEKW